MKKKVRIYKAPDGEGKVINKTSKFLAKAQMGGTPDASMLSYPGAQQAQVSEQDQTSQLMQFVANDITSQVAKEETLFKLVNVMGVPIDTATELYMVIAEQITKDVEEQDDEAYEQETGQKREKEESLSKDAVITQNPEEDVDYDLYDDTGSDIIMQDSEEEDILDEALDPLAEARYGGIPKMKYNDGGEYDVALPSAESYSSLIEPMTGYDLVSQMAWNSNDESSSPYSANQDANSTLDYSRLQNGGSYKKAKKKYVTSVMNLLKKQMGGAADDVDPNQGDPTGSNFRNGRLQAFTNTVKQNAQMQAMQNQIEQQYDQMMQDGGMIMEQQDVENPMHHLQLYSQAARGIFDEPMNETIKAQEGLSIGANLPKGFYKRTMKRFGNIPNLREVDVRKSGLFGPKQYTMYFDPSPLQQINNPLSAEIYGYGASSTAARKQTRTFDAVKTYTNLAAETVNKESLKEVEQNTPGNQATEVKEEVTTTTKTPIKQVNAKELVSPVANPVVQETVTRDEWGRPSTSKWYGFNAKTKTWDPKYGFSRNMFDPAPGVTNIARGIASYKESPYVTAFRQQTDNTLKSLFKQTGGTIEDPFSNPMAPLQRFVGGGYDPSINDLSENQIQYMDSKDVTDPYMQGGGFIKNFIPANLTRSSRNDVVQRVYNPLTGETRQGGPGAGNYISAIDVRKRGITGTPKKYTIYYGAQGDPRYENLITLDGAKGAEDKSSKVVQKSEREQALENAGYGQRTDVTGLKAKSKAAIRKGERQRDRELEKLYKEDPTNVAFDPMNLDAPADRTASNTSAYNFNDITYPTTEEEFATWGVPKDPLETTTAYQFPEVDFNDDAAWGMPQDMVVGPSDVPVNTNIPTPIAKPATGKQTEEFCFGNSCFEIPEQQATEYALFNDTPRMLSKYAAANNLGFYNSETGDLDLSQVDRETLKKALEEGLKGPGFKNKTDINNLDAYVDSWLKYQQDNQNAFGTLSSEDLSNDASAMQDFGASEKYADFLNATGQTAEGRPFSVWDTTGPLQFSENDAAQLVKQPNIPRRMTSDFGPTAMEGPMATAEDQVPTFEEQYMDGFQPTITQEMIDQASGLRIPQESVDMGAWSGMAYPGVPFEPGVNPFELPIGGGQDYYPPFAQPVAPVISAPTRNNESVNRPVPSGPTLEQIRNQQRRNPNAGKDYSFTPNMSGMQKDPDYIRAMQNARKDGVVTNQEAENAAKIFKQKQAEQEKAKIASQAQRTINQIMSSSAPASEKVKAREKVVLQMQQRWDEIDRAATSRKFGGDLSRFVNGGDNEPFTGESPVAYTNNPLMQGKSDLDLISLNSGIQGAQGQVDWSTMSSTPAGTTYKGPQAPEIKIDPMQQEEYQVAKTYSEPLAVDVKNKLTQGEREARLIAGNTLMRGVAGLKNRIDDTKQMEGFYDNFTADNLYASDPSRDRGDYAESGLYRPDEQGQTWYGRSAQMGGYIDDEFEDGEEVYMTDEEIKEYMANGGQIEFI